MYKIYTLYITCIILLGTFSLQAAAISWDGGGGDGLWSTATNWSSDNVPTSVDDVSIATGETVILSSLVTAIKSLSISNNSILTISSTGDLTIDGAANKGILSSAGTTINNNGVILVMNAGDDGLEIEGNFNNNMGATLTSMNVGDKGIFADIASATYTFTNSGMINISGTTRDGIFVRGAFNNESTGVIIIDNVGTTTDDSALRIDANASGTLTNEGMITTTNSFYAGVWTNGGSFVNNGTIMCDGFTNEGTVTNNGIVNNTKIVRGAGTFNQNETFNNSSEATFEPGASPGTLSITGDFALDNGTYKCEINGTIANSQYDEIAITGTATLTGARLEVDWGSYTPSGGESYTILTANSIIGNFNSIIIPSVSGITFSAMNTGTAIIISAQTLPVELLSFEVSVSEKSTVNLSWETASEINNSGFEIQRSLDRKQWDEIGFVKGQVNSSNVQLYTFEDARPHNDDNYYRLKQIDNDGNFEYSDVVLAKLYSNSNDFKIAPNPTRDGRISIYLNASDLQLHNLQILSSDGQVQKNLYVSKEVEYFDLSELVNGMYYLHIKGPQINKTKLFHIVK